MLGYPVVLKNSPYLQAQMHPVATAAILGGLALAMSLGVAVTTAGLASIAVLAKGVARRLTRAGSRGGALALAGLELVSAGVVLAAGVALLIGTTAGMGA